MGLIVNPIAGMGGRVGLKGTDGKENIEKARKLGATPVSPARAIEALQTLQFLKGALELITAPLDMGEEEAMHCGFNPRVVGRIQQGATSAADTRAAAKEMLNLQVQLILFVGGDGTAKDVYESVGQLIPALGVPAGVKIHSGVFGVTPRKAGELAGKFLRGETKLQDAEIMDVDEDAFRMGRVSAKLYGYLRVPYEERLIQSTKDGSSTLLDEKTNQQIIADYVVELMEDDWYYVLGPGTTVKAVADRLGVTKTLLGVDVVSGGKTVASDVNEEQLLALIGGKKAKIIVSPIGRQGFIFGRGNQQISPKVIRRVGVENVCVLATRNKLSSFQVEKALLVDTGDENLNKMLSGYRRVITGYREEVVTKVAV
jgi:predicted polyphosphate/ATP-dependent NAD kinase